MMDESVDKQPKRIFADNLTHWHKELEAPSTLAQLQWAELAAQLAEMGFAEQELSVLLREIRSYCEITPRGVGILQTQEITERLSFCRAFTQATAKKTEKAPAYEPLPTPCGIAMLDSPLFAAALACFAPYLKEARPRHCATLTAVAEELASGNAALGLFPLEDRLDGKLFRFYEQLEHYELQIKHTCDVTSPEGGSYVRFALLEKRSHAPLPLKKSERLLECVLFEEEHHALCELLSVADLCKLSLRRTDALPAGYREDGFLNHLILKDHGNDTAVFALYLSLFMPRTAITAQYTHLLQGEL